MSVLSFIKTILRFLRLIDQDHMVSLTNLAVIVVIVKIWQAKSSSYADMGALLVALSGYNAKKMINTAAGLHPTGVALD